MTAAEEAGLLEEGTYIEQLVVAALLEDAATAREVAAKALEEQRKNGGTGPQGTEAERAISALMALAERKPAEAVALLEPLTFDAAHSETVTLWSIAQMQLKNWAAARKG